MSIKQLIQKINTLYPIFIEEVKKSEYNIFELMDNEIKELIVNNINLNLNDKEYRILTNKLYGYYSYIDNIQELEENIKIDYGKMANSTKKNDNNLQDISSLVDDLF